jgi:uncharacterized protein (DUF736 family)
MIEAEHRSRVERLSCWNWPGWEARKACRQGTMKTDRHSEWTSYALEGPPFISGKSVAERSKRPLQWADLAEGRLCLDRLCRNGASRFSSPGFHPFLAKQENSACAILRVASVASDASSVASGRSIAIEAAWCGLETENGDFNMATIGTFKKSGSNEFTGDIVTLSVLAKGVRIIPDLRATGENAPSHRVVVGRAEIGAAWSKRSNEGREYLGLKLDDPSFNAPIYANLFDDEDGEGYSLIWSRPNGRRSD